MRTIFVLVLVVTILTNGCSNVEQETIAGKPFSLPQDFSIHEIKHTNHKHTILVHPNGITELDEDNRFRE